MKKQTLPSIRISEQTHSNIYRAIKKYNETSLQEISIQEFRRIAYELLSQMILTGQSIPAKITTK